MTFAESIRTCFSKFADFNGTASRSEFWWFMLFVFVVALALNYLSQTIGAIFALAVLLPQLAVGARRLHDTAKSGWWQLLLIVPFGIVVLIIFWVHPPKR